MSQDDRSKQVAENVIPMLDMGLAALAVTGFLLRVAQIGIGDMVMLVSLSVLAMVNLVAIATGSGKMIADKQVLLRLSRKVGHAGIAVGAIGVIYFFQLWVGYPQVLSVGVILLWGALGIRFWYRNPDIPPSRNTLCKNW